jgi:hypothetical protein
MANKTITQLDAAQSLNDNMVIAVQDTNTTYKTTLADVKAYCGGGGSTDKYKAGDIVKDDSNTAIGTISGFKTDANNVSYAVCCLNGSYRGNGEYYESKVAITNMPMYSDHQTVWSNKETATFNTDCILAMSGTSSACNLCRAASFVINGVTYYGQFPTLDELVDIFKNRIIINSQDSSGSNPIPTGKEVWSSTQSSSYGGWYIGINGVTTANKNYSFFVCPVLEIPLED